MGLWVNPIGFSANTVAKQTWLGNSSVWADIRECLPVKGRPFSRAANLSVVLQFPMFLCTRHFCCRNRGAFVEFVVGFWLCCWTRIWLCCWVLTNMWRHLWDASVGIIKLSGIHFAVMSSLKMEKCGLAHDTYSIKNIILGNHNSKFDKSCLKFVEKRLEDVGFCRL